MPQSAGPSATTATFVSQDVLRGLRCSPSRRSLKFSAGAHARHFLAFDTSISRETRLILFMELFVFRQLLVDAAVLPVFQVATYTPEEQLEVRVVTDPRHPAYGQAGLYAKNSIPHNTIVTPYSGFVEVFATSCNSRTYTMGFGSFGDDYALDAEFVGNYGRYANDPRGVSTLQANLSAENRFNDRGESFTALVTRRQISAGEEILMSYGKAHRLSATPWTTMQGEPMMRPRMGGLVPFPAFCAAEAPRFSRVEKDDVGDTAPSFPTFRGGATPTSADTPKRHITDTNGSAATVTAPASTLPLPSVANDLLWECTQCGMWMLCEASGADTPLPCSACGTPKLSGARLVSLLSSPAVTQHALLQEAGLSNSDFSPSVRATTSSSPSKSPLLHLSAADSSLSSSFPFSSERVDWPMNVPFLPWQVWDAAVPLSVLAKYSRFETQKHMFLYAVDTGFDEEKKKHGHGKAADAAAERRGHGKRKRETSKRVKDEELSEHDGSDLEEHCGVDAVSAPSAAYTKLYSRASRTGKRIRSSRRNGGFGSTGEEPTHRLKRGKMWERQGDVDPEELECLNQSLTPATPLMPHTTLEKSTCSAHVFSPFSLSPQQMQRSLHTRYDAPDVCENSEDVAEHENQMRTALTKCPLTLLVSSAQGINRLIVLRRPVLPISRSTTFAGVTTIATSADRKEVAFSPQVASMRRRLQCMTRRLFTGKAFKPGEVVSYIGGLVRQRGDSRCRVSDSCLEIPLRFFLPPTLRKLCRVPIVDPGPSHVMGGGTHRTSCSDEGSALHRFCQRLDGFSLVVTNEFMYCPCVAWEAEANEEESTQENTHQGVGQPSYRAAIADEVESALEACNVALVLTLDSLGSPYACAVATKAIGAFEPLLARSQ